MTEIDIDGKKFLTAIDAGARLGRSTAWLSKQAQLGTITRHKWGHNNVYPVEGIVKLQESLLKKEEDAQRESEAQPDLLKIPTVANMLGVSRAYVWQMVEAGEIDYVDLTKEGLQKRSGLRIARAEVERLVQVRSHKRKIGGQSA